MPINIYQLSDKKKFNPLKNRVLIYAFSAIMMTGFILDIIFLNMPVVICYANFVNVMLSVGVVILFYFRKIGISSVVKIQILGLLANMVISTFINPVDKPDFTIEFIRNAIIMIMFIPVYGLYCGKFHIFHIGAVYVVLYIIILFRMDNHFLENNAPMLIFSAVIYHLAVYYIFDILEKTQRAQIELNRDLESQKELLVLKNQDLEQKNQYIFQQAKELKELLATKDKIFSIIAHDLRTPFNTILGFSEILSNNWKVFDADQKSNYAKTINDQAKNTFNMLENLLNWASSQTGQLIFKPEPISLNEAFRDAIKDFELCAKMKNISIEYILPEDIEIVADRNMISTILRNLVSNSIKFTHENGRISLTALKKPDQVEIMVSDNGVGLDKDKQSKLFVMGAVETTKGTANEKGCGLGLILCKEFVEKHGGEIRVQSDDENGCKFAFTIPSKPIGLNGDGTVDPV
jgi:signal transduction histidine kinase